MAIRLGQSQQIHLPEDEIIERLLAHWSLAVSKGSRPSPELYRQCLSEVLRDFVREGREGATTFMQRFAQTYTRDDLQPLFAADLEARGIVTPAPPKIETATPPTAPPVATPPNVSPQMLKIVRMRQKMRRQRVLGILLFILAAALLAGSGRFLDALPKQVALHDIPDLLQVSWSDGERWPGATLPLALALWGQPHAKAALISGLYQRSATESSWLLALKSGECSAFVQRLDDDKAATWALRAAAEALDFRLTGAVATQRTIAVYAHYPVAILVARAHAYPAGASGEVGWLETGISALPEGIGAVGMIRIRFAAGENDSLGLYRQPALVVYPVQGRAFYCRQPTVWGWYTDRDRYLP